MKTIITIGSGYSGSSAVYQFLRSSNFFFDPFPNKEFSLTYDPGGIMDIENCLTNNFSPNKNKFIYERFLNNIKFYTNPSSGLKPGKNLNIDKNNLEKILNSYIESIVSLTYEGESNYIKYNNSKILNLYKKFLSKFQKKIKGEMVLFCGLDEFEKKTYKFFEDLFSINNDDKKDVIIDQAGNIWNPFSSTKYFTNPKIIITLRDPRDIFSEFKGKSAFSYPGKDVKKFCAWYKNIILKMKESEYNNSNILKINFEDFVFNNKAVLSKISDHLIIDINPNQVDFDLLRSQKNVERYKDNLKENEISIIEKDLKEYLHYSK